MRKLFGLIVALLFTLTTVVPVVAQQAQTPAEPKPAEKADKAEKAKKPAAKTASGTVKSASADSVVVAGKEKGKEAEWTFAVDPKTKIQKGGKEITAADLKAGDPVRVRYVEQEGKAVAQMITVQTPRAKAANPCAAKPMEKPAEKKQ